MQDWSSALLEQSFQNEFHLTLDWPLKVTEYEPPTSQSLVFGYWDYTTFTEIVFYKKKVLLKGFSYSS